MDKPISNPNNAQPETLRFSYSIKEGEDFHARFLMQMSQIRDCAYSRDQRLAYDKSYHPVFQNLLEAKFAKEHCENLIVQHKQNIADGKESIYHGNQIDVKNPIDDDLNVYFKDFFIRGTIAIDCLMRHTAFMGSGIGFLFIDDNPKKYQRGLEKFPLKNDDPRFTALVDMIKNNKTNWYSRFREIRRKIEHEGFALPNSRYHLNKENKVEVIFPTFGKQSIEEIFLVDSPPQKISPAQARARRKGVVQTLTSLQTRRGVGEFRHARAEAKPRRRRRRGGASVSLKEISRKV